MAIVVGLAASCLAWWVWGSWSPSPVGSDESAYLLQARIFAAGRLVGEARPLPSFFWQYHVFTDPVLAAKYPPGHSLLLSLGELVRAPWLVPLFSAGLSAALLYLLTRRWTSRRVALLSVAVAVTSEMWLRFTPSYFSETTTAALFLLGWLALLRHYDSGQARWLALLAAAVGLGAITRPLTMLAFAAPAGIAALVSVNRHAAWRQIVLAVGVVAAMLGFNVAWSSRVIGTWRGTPHGEYARRFIPSDHMGFTPDIRTPADSLLPEQRRFAADVARIHAQHRLANLPRIAAARAVQIAGDASFYGVASMILGALAWYALPAGVFLIALGTVLSVFLAYFVYAHVASWTLYYLELEAPLAFLIATGAFAASRLVATVLARRTRWRLEQDRAQRFVFAVLSLALVVPALGLPLPYRRAHVRDRSLVGAFERATGSLPHTPAIAFVRERMDVHPEQSVVENVVDLRASPLWIAHDLGEKNGQLASLAPERAAYLIEEIRGRDSLAFHVTKLERRASSFP